MSDLDFGDYRLTQLLGRGGMAEVYQGFDPALQRPVALKVILPHLAAEPGFTARFQQEARLVASLRHNHIVQLYDFDIAAGRPIMVMEFLPGGSLKARLANYRGQGRTMPVAERLQIVDALASALDYAHRQGAVHRDIKPANVLFTADGEPVITDFGIAKILHGEQELTLAGALVGTPAYMAPEQASGEPVDPRTDVYALGVILYELCTGRTPFQAASVTALLEQQRTAAPPSPRSFDGAISAAVEAVILRALAKRPADRYASAGELARALRAAQADVPAEEPLPAAFAATVVDGAELPTAPAAVDSATAPPVAAQTQPETPAESRSLLSRLVAMAALVAPLVGYDLPESATTAQDRRALIATILGMLGIFLATLQFVIGFFELVSHPLQSLAGALPFLAALLLLAAAAVAAATLARAASTRRRLQSGGLLALLLLVGLVWGSWFVYASLRPPGALVIAVGDFDGSQASSRVDYGRRIAERLRRELADVGAEAEVVRTLEVYADAAAARARGLQRKATLVIWGWYDDAGVSPHVEILIPPSLARTVAGAGSLLAAVQAVAAGAPRPQMSAQLDFAHYVRTPAVTLDLDLYVQEGPRQMAALAATVLGVDAFAEGDMAGAETAYRRAGELEPGEWLYPARLGMLLESVGRLDGAAEAYRTVLALSPGNEGALYGLSSVAYRRCDLESAVQTMQTLTDQSPSSAWRAFLAALYAAAGRHSEAQALYEQLQTAPAGDGTAHLAAAGDLYARGRLDEAAAEYRTVLAAGTDQSAWVALAHSGLGRIAYERGELLLTVTEFAQALQADPAHVDARLGLGDSHLRRGEVERAMQIHEEALALQPDYARRVNLETAALAAVGIHLRRAIVLARVGRDQAAEEALVAARAAASDLVEQLPRHPWGHFLVGLTAAAAGEAEAAETAFGQAIQCDRTLEQQRVRALVELERLAAPEGAPARAS